MCLWKYAAYDIIDMANKCVVPKYQTSYTSSTGKLSFLFISIWKMGNWTKNGFVSSIGVIGLPQNSQFYPSCISKIFTKNKKTKKKKKKGKRMSLNWSMKLSTRIYFAELINTPFFRPLNHSHSLLGKGFFRRID